MKTVAIVSMKGGVGKTTVAANLGSLLTRDKDSNVLLLDFDPRNQLGLHFGMPTTEGGGLAQAALSGGSWAQALYYRLDRSPFLPFGNVTDRQRIQLEMLLMDQPMLLRDRLADPALHDYNMALIDVAPGPSVYISHVLPIADLVVVVMLADAASFATLPSIREQLDMHCRPRPGFAGAYILLNAVDESKKLTRDIKAAVLQYGGVQVLPFVVHHDQAVREALGFQRPVVDQGQSSQVTKDFAQLAAWVKDEISRLPQDVPVEAVPEPIVEERSVPQPLPPQSSTRRRPS